MHVYKACAKAAMFSMCQDNKQLVDLKAIVQAVPDNETACCLGDYCFGMQVQLGFQVNCTSDA